jgi:hypothetical protein
MSEMNLVIAYQQWELTVMWVEAKMKCDEVTDNMMKQPIFQPTGLLQYITALQTCILVRQQPHILAVQICTMIDLAKTATLCFFDGRR